MKEDNINPYCREAGMYDNKIVWAGTMVFLQAMALLPFYNEQIKERRSCLNMNKERFHNALALALGYERILNDKRYKIIVDEKADDPKIIIKDADGTILLSIRVSEVKGIKQECLVINNDSVNNDLNKFVDAIHQAFIKATTQLF